MANEMRTNLVIQGEAKGLDKVLQQVLGINQKASKGLIEQANAYKTVQKEVDGYQKQLRGFAKQQAEISRNMLQMKDKSTPAYKKMEESLKAVNKEARDTERVIRNLEKAFSDQAEAATKVSKAQSQMMQEQRREQARAEQARRGAFTQGLLQAAAPGMAPLFLQRGPGMLRQTAGMAIGGLARRGMQTGLGIGGAAFTGIQGMQQGLANIPVVGGFLAGQLATGAGYAGQAMAYQRQRLDLAPYLTGAGPTTTRQTAGQLAVLQRRERAFRGAISRRGGIGAAQQGADTYARGKRLLAGEVGETWGATQILQESVQQARLQQGLPLLSADKLPTANVKKTETAPNWFETSTEYKGLENINKKTLALTDKLVKQRYHLLQRAQTTGLGAGAERSTPEALAMAAAAGQPGTTLQERYQRAYGTAEQFTTKTLDARAAGFRRERSAILARQRQEAFAGFNVAAQMGVQYRGLGRQAAVQEAAAIMQATGGRLGVGLDAGRFGETYMGKGERRRRLTAQEEMLATAMAARTAFGVAPGVAGAFGMAGRRGGLVSGLGQSAQSLTNALRDAMELGLEGSEINVYLQQIASGIQQFQSTGIPFARESVQSMGAELARMGIAGTRAARIAGGFTQYAQQIGARGPTSGLDLLLMQRLGGYTGKGGPAELEQTYINLERMRGEIGEKGVLGAGSSMQKVFKDAIEMAGGGVMGRMFLRRKLSQMGIQTGAEEMRLLGKQVSGIQLTPEETERVGLERARLTGGEAAAGAIGSPGQLMRMASGLVSQMGPNLRKQAAIQDKQLAVGQSLAKTIQNLEDTAANSSKLVSNLVAGPMTSLTNKFAVLSSQLESVTREGGGLDSLIWKLGQLVIGQ